MVKTVLEKYDKWMASAGGDADLVRELRAMGNDEDAIFEAFHKELQFGTAGLRGIIGAGTNRINIYTVARASQGIANYIRKHFNTQDFCVAISYDSRVKSDIFAEVTAGTFAANGIKAFIYPELMPVPCLSYAVRELGCAMGVMITASHNPAEYNGYKVYNSEGCQITTNAADEIFSEIEKLDFFDDTKKMDFNNGLEEKLIEYISGSVFDKYIKNVLSQSISRSETEKDIKIVYSPLHGSGYVPVTTALKEAGYENVSVVAEQVRPDGDFPTCVAPNPENKEAMSLGLKLADERGADIVIATDPDCDRVGVAVKINSEDNRADFRGELNGAYNFLTGNEIGILLLDYICGGRVESETMPKKPIFFKTIVTSDLAETVASHYGVETRNVLTGFKFIGEQIGFLEAKGEADRFIFGFEESYGYLVGAYVRDKDGVVASLLICEMAAYYKAFGKTLLDRLNEIYELHGYCINSTHSFEFPGASGMDKMREIMRGLREIGTSEYEDVKAGICGLKIVEKIDYMDGIDGLPKADVIKFILEDDCSVIIRPSGTEPKIKVYLSVKSDKMADAKAREEQMLNAVDGLLVL